MSLIILHKFCGFSSIFIYLFFTVLSCFEVLFTSNVALTFSNLLIPFFFCHSTSTRHVYFICINYFSTALMFDYSKH